MSDIDAIKRVLLGEKTDRMRKLDMLVRQGMMSPAQLPMLHRGLDKLQGGQTLTPSERTAVAKVMDSLMYIVTGDDTVFQKAKMHTQKNRYQTEETEELNDEEIELDMFSESYKTGHKSYTDAINHAFDHHKKSGLHASDDDRMTHVGLNSKKPGEGKTTRVNVPATHAKTGKKHMVHVQVYNKGGTHPYELNTYSSTTRKMQKEELETIEEKNVPTNPKLWASKVAAAKSKFDVYPSAYANGWAAKEYKKAGGGWKTQKEEVEIEEKMDLAKADMGDVIKDFRKSDAPQFKGKSDKKKQQMAIAAKLSAERDMKEDAQEDIVDEIAEMSYKDKFQAMLKKTGKSLADMSDEEKKKFFGSVDAAHKAKNEEVKSEETETILEYGKMSGDKASHDTGGFRISNKVAAAAKERVKQKRMAKVSVKTPIKTRVSDIGPGGKETVRKDFNEEEQTAETEHNDMQAYVNQISQHIKDSQS